jgi:DNA-binding transcriptional LysR family regulator
MELRHLRYFVALAETLHFGRAAARLGITQPPLSRQIRDLEREVGVPLVVRGARGLRVTTAGHRFLKEARRILTAAEHAREVARSEGDRVQGTLSLGVQQTALFAILSRVLPEFHRRHPGVRVRLRTLSNGEQIEGVLRGDLDAALPVLPCEAGDLAMIPIYEERLVVVLPGGHRLADRDPVRLRELAGEGQVLFYRSLAPAFHDLLLDALRRAGLALPVTAEADSLSSMVGLVAAGMGVAFLPGTLGMFALPSVAVRSTDPPLSPVGFAVARRREPPSPVVRAFGSLLLEMFPPLRTLTTPARSTRSRRRSAPSSRAGRRS